MFVVRLELFFLAAQVARGSGAEVIREREEDFGSEGLEQSPPDSPGKVERRELML